MNEKQLLETIERTIKEFQEEAKRHPERCGAYRLCIEFLKKRI